MRCLLCGIDFLADTKLSIIEKCKLRYKISKYRQMKKILFGLTIILISIKLSAQDYKPLTLEDIYQNNIFRTKSVAGFRWMKDGSYYTSLVHNAKTKNRDILKFATKSGEVTDTLVHGKKMLFANENEPIPISSYEFNKDETKVLIATEVTSIYRRSTKAIYYIYDILTEKLQRLVDGDKQSFATFSSDGKKVAFVRNNDLFIKDLASNELITVTSDGKKNEIINGMADWVYEEEFSLSKAFFWSPDGNKIAFLKFDEKEVPMYNMQKWTGLYPEDYIYKYPKAGEKNSEVTVHVYDLATRQLENLPIGKEKDVYIARLQWLPAGEMISVIRLNRLQNKLDIFHGNASTRKTELIYTEQSKTYLDIDQLDDLTYLADGESFIISSEMTGFKHLYHYAINGDFIQPITNGDWAVDNFLGIDEKRDELYYTSTEVSSIERHLYSMDIKGKNRKKLTLDAGVHSVNFSHDFKYYIDTYSSFDFPAKTELYQAKGKLIKVLAENSDYQKQTEEYGCARTEYFQVGIEGGDSLNAYMMKPLDFNKDKKYPVLMYVYGGPGSQNVMNRWNGNMWHHFLTQQGYIIVCVDNRGTGGKGRDFQHITYKQLGKYESRDQIASAKYLAALPFIDQNRIGIWGWSYGGYMSSLSLFLGNDMFKAAIAVAPVTNWRYYDTIYTERYLQKPQDNPSGYDDYSPQTHADKLSGAFLLVHGTGDDNVHFQNAVELQNALIKANKQFDSFYYPDRNHGIYGGNTRLHLYTMMTNFILQKL